MVDEYHELANAIEVSKESDFTFPRSHALLRAIKKHRDYSIVRP